MKGKIMALKWIKTKHKGLRFRKHTTRKHGIEFDRFYQYRHTTIDVKTKKKIRVEESLGWLSDGWTEDRCLKEILQIKQSKTTGEGPLTLAEKKKQARKRREAAEAAKVQAESQNITFADVWPKYLDLAKSTKTAKSVLTETISIKKWALPSIGKKRMIDICTLDLERIKKKMLDAGRAPRTAEYLMAMIRQVFNYAIDNGLYAGLNPAKKVKRLKYDNKRLRFLSKDEAANLLDLLKSKNINLHDMSLFSLHTGARAGEIFSLEWNDVDMAAGQITFRDTKNAESRHVYMSDAVKKMLEQRRQTADPNKISYIFPGKNGQRITDISRTFDKIIEDSGINNGITDRRQKFTFHSLRHSAASWLVQAGTPLYTVQKLLGHKTAALTERYSHLAPANLRAVTAVFNDATDKQDAEIISMNGIKQS